MKKPFGDGQFGKIGVLVNFVIQKLKSKLLVCLSFLWWQFFFREQEKIFYTYSGPHSSFYESFNTKKQTIRRRNKMDKILQFWPEWFLREVNSFGFILWDITHHLAESILESSTVPYISVRWVYLHSEGCLILKLFF